MTEHTTEILVGGAVLAAAFAFGVFTVQVAGIGVRSEGYPLTASFRSLEGISVGTDVRLAGVRVGTVTGVELNPETYRAETVVRINGDIKIPDDSAIVIASEGLLGGNFVEISPGGSPFFYEAGAEVLDTQGAVSLMSLLMKFVGGQAGQ
ncbi:outer membrane lipid asymmetry maintenance protein MlaD [Puniceibacterium sp. IMCC21224]|uniref:outer membrane lipid asymmetry maintenance protein MlaD n=1 Tax=Puniceibacterium sp. IMCC21224 TaxID=1618204 RepID=UPI00064DD0DF|nr:outer membrane lipid asymmetry maintenance protein MlaD [Puniceibacterium sp. IMCC21224]KMK66500.1 mce related protein [Puniceibacterium sp. IMCC21224]